MEWEELEDLMAWWKRSAPQSAGHSRAMPAGEPVQRVSMEQFFAGAGGTIIRPTKEP